MELLAQYFTARSVTDESVPTSRLFGISDERAQEFINAMEAADQQFDEHMDDLGRDQFVGSEMIAFLLDAVDKVFKPQNQAEAYYAYFTLGGRLEQLTSTMVEVQPFDFNEWVAETQQQREQRPQSKRPIATA